MLNPNSKQAKADEERRMSEDQTYNGWSNYETWNVNFWINNDEFMYRRLSHDIGEEKDPQVVALLIETFVVGMRAFSNGWKFGDLDTEAEFEKVNYLEIAEAWVE